ncbi:MAG: hypothetical protein KDB79_10210, partial [Acidobacteria bacterium]|nr:hypothetical protein [Acidobacteriota bacterium]
MTKSFYVMKNSALLIFLLTFSIVANSQEKNVEVAVRSSDTASQKTKTPDEKAEFEHAINQSLAGERISLLKKFLEDFPDSAMKVRAQEIIVGSRAELADEKLRFSDTEEGVRLFRLAVEEAPVPVSDKLFSGLLVKFPSNLFFRGQRKDAIEVAKLIEEKIGDNQTQLLGLAAFYLSVENASEAKRLAGKVVEVNPESAAAYHTIGFANRLDFSLEAAADAFARALEIDPESITTKINLAEMKRALGQSSEADSIYRGILEADPANVNARTGLVLSLFDAERREEAEAEMTKALDLDPNNLILLTGASYWYAAHNDPQKAIETARKVLTFEPRYTWTYIALARGLVLSGDPLGAEIALLTARQYGNFPTLEYELAAARIAAGFYREAAEGLRKSFSIEDGKLKTKLGGRIDAEADDFIDLLARERRASIFQYTPADSSRDSLKLKELLALSQDIDSEIPDADVETAADEFISGDDKMKMHRQLFVAKALLEKKKALPKVLEITKDAVFGVDNALEVTTPSAAILADELYDSRKLAEARGQTILVPDIPKQTLSKIVRGKIEEIAGWALFQQEKPDEAISKLKLATTVLPKDSAWARSTMWKLGTILESQGKSEEALEAYLKGYSPERDGTVKKIVVENLYQKLNGSLDGLEERLNKKADDVPKTSIFTNKPIAESNVKPEEKPAEQDPDTAKQNETESASPVLTTGNVPNRVPIARSAVVKTQPLEAKDDEIVKSGVSDVQTESPAETVLKTAEKEKPAEDASVSLKDKILESGANITTLPPVASETLPADKDTGSTIITIPKTETEKAKGSPTAADKILVPAANITALPPVLPGNLPPNPPEKRDQNTTRGDIPLFDPVIIKVPKTEVKT